ncbi:MAG: macrolide ABC transporter ATP-binding protein [Candidatus Liptonbacteria bacterium RIFCSPLOWO2_01_FULL_45_15]|uniref:Macrolide ABC transporter ATP-binding protein n=1 Tax=Candidatus Liptonbacteria bacterium RIFCSPLOWO2_01_FULL_45_15 TaxID=1798649 RepID=A0A1G2CF43_9BACT|nr:MAG: macrolide ABC transporter ATP-binding protein [Candidatus Liptonbacteria bacterium RIFCSPLOWO2_01_FULL_45_15]
MNSSPLIKVQNLEKTYRDDGEPTPALRGISFSVNNGEFVAIMGPSGCGKSTLLHILGFLDRQTEGAYEFEGRFMDSYTDEELAHVRNKKMGFVFQTFNLLPRLTVLENVKLPLLYSGIKESFWNEKAKQAIESVGLRHRMDHMSSKLSGGEKQRVAIARALVNDPQVIFADEPTGNLDSKSGQAVMSTIQKLNIEDKRTIILITHETYTAEHAQRVIRLLDGKVESDKPVDNRRKSNEFEK